MRKLALDDDILLSIEKPARYIGGEVNAVMKEKELEAGEIAVRFALLYISDQTCYTTHIR